MSILQELQQSLLSDAPSYIEFLYRYDPKKKQVFAFYEGDEDSSFYRNIIMKYIDQDCELEEIVAGCKNNVLKLQREFNWSLYNKDQIAFFVDRDLSFWLNESTEYGENVFVTDDYSVENYVANPRGFISWLVHFEGFARAKKKELEYMVSEYESCNIIFQREMMPIMAQAVVAKRHDPTVSLSDYKPKTVFRYQNGHLSFTIEQNSSILKKWNLTDENKSEVDAQSKRFNEQIQCYSVRGKWLLRFMAEVGEYMRVNPAVFAPSLGNIVKASPTCAVPVSSCISAIAPYCIESIPKRLQEFINDTYCKYCCSGKNERLS